MIHHYLNSIDYAVVCLYLAVMIGLGIYLKRRATRNLDEYLIGGRSLPWWMLGMSGVMDFWDLAGTMIIVSFLYMLGPRGLFIEFRGGAVLVLAVIMLWTGKWHRRSGCLTAAEWMLYRFGDGPAGRIAQFARAAAGIVVTVGMIAYLVKGAGLFLSIFLPFTPAQCAFVLLVAATLYTMFSGFHGVVMTHILQLGIILAAASSIIALGLSQVADAQSLSDLALRVTGNPNWISATPAAHTPMPAGYKLYEPLLLFASLYLVRNVLFGLGAGDDPKYFAARSDADCGKLTLLWILLISIRWPMMMCIAILGLVLVDDLFPDKSQPEQAARLIQSRLATTEENWGTVVSQIAFDSSESSELAAELQQLLGPEWQTKLLLVSYFGTINAERIMPAVLLYSIPSGLRSLILVSLLAAAMAGLSAWLNQSAGFFVRDIYQKHVRPRAAMQELLIATWVFIGGMVCAGFMFAFSVKSINDVWAWIIMGLGGGMMIPQLLPLYWWRFNGSGYAIGITAGLVAALALRLVGNHLPPSWTFVNTETWYLPILVAVGSLSSIVGTLLFAPAPEPVLRHFYVTTLPFGIWPSHKQLLPEPLRRKVAAEHRRDVLALPFALLFQIAIFLAPMLLVMRNWTSLAGCLVIVILAFGGLHWIWLRRIHESDDILAMTSYR